MDKLVLKKSVLRRSNPDIKWPRFQLMADKIVNKHSSKRSKQELFSLNSQLTATINAISDEYKTTNFFVLLTAFYTFLQCYTNKSQVSLIALKLEKKCRKYLIRFTNGSLENVTFAELLRRVSSGECVECTLIPPSAKQDETNVSFTLRPHDEYSSKNQEFTNDLDFSLFLYEDDFKISGVVHYNDNIFETQAILKMVANFQVLVRSICENSQNFIYDLKMISDEEEKLIVDEFSRNSFSGLSDKSIIQLFEEQVLRTPNFTAIVENEIELSYEQLNKKANQVAHYIMNLCVDQNYALILPQSIDFVMSVIAILKAGGTCAPISVKSSTECIQHLIKDLNFPVVITTKEVAKKKGLKYSKILFLDEIHVDSASNCDKNVDIIRKETELAYIMFTSGSTGKPKGVRLEFKSITNVIQWFIRVFSLKNNDRCSLIANSAFDAHITEMWPQLLSGASLFVCPKKVRRNSQQLLQWLKNQKITVAFVPTSVAIPIIAQPVTDIALRKLIIGGERLNRIPNSLLPFEVINGYGPTETSVIATFMNLSHQKTNYRVPLIGKAIDNVHLYVLNKNKRPVPIGAPGELYIAGDGVANGYLTNKKLTSECFTDCLFEKSVRVYKTGDVVSWTDCGHLIYKGRLKHEDANQCIDHAIIEEIVYEYPLICQVLIVKKPMHTTCYCVPYPENHDFPLKHFKLFLKKRIPQCFLPLNLVILSHFPLTANGKISKKSLPEYNF